MVRLREVKKYGTTWIVKLEPTDMDDLGLKVGDKIDIEDVVVKTKKGGYKKWIKQWRKSRCGCFGYSIPGQEIVYPYHTTWTKKGLDYSNPYHNLNKTGG